MCAIRTAYIFTCCFFILFNFGSCLVEFEETVAEGEAESGKAVLIECSTKSPVVECQWYWISLTEQSAPLLISTFPAYGKGSRGCSVRFKNVTVEQQGLWVCGAREEDDANFTMAPLYRLTVVEPTPTPPALPTTSEIPVKTVQFAEITQDSEVKVRMPMHLICKTAEEVEECRWTWRANETSEEVEIKKVTPFGEQRLNCDIKLDHALPEHDGIWTCGARFEEQDTFATARPIKITIMTEVGFVQLSQDLQVALGASVLLRCITNIGVEKCRWKWQGIGADTDQPIVIKQFPAYGEEGRDCSVRLKNVLEEHSGVWTCQARLEENTEFFSAPPATLTILYPANISFLEEPQDILAPLGSPVVLRCVISTHMDECSWTWRPLTGDTEPMLVKSFPPFNNQSRDCSVRFKSIRYEQEGIWGCSIRGPPDNTTLSTRLAKLKVYEPGPVSFVKLTQNILINPGGPLLLQCITSTKMEQCQWTWKAAAEVENATPVVVRQFKPVEQGGRDCTIRLASVKTEEEGIWTCGVRSAEETEFTLAASTTVTMLQPESVTVALWSSPLNSVSLACRMSNPRKEATCYWYHLPNLVISEKNHTKQYSVHHTKSSGVCTLTFAPTPHDLGQWACGFNVATQAGDWEMAAANLILLTTSTPGFSVSEDKMGWIIGLLAGMVLILTASLVAVSICKCRGGTDSNESGLNSSLSSQGEKKDNSRYTDTPTKIDFQFRENSRNKVTPISETGGTQKGPVSEESRPTSDHQHIYERVDQYVAPTACKSIYENLE